MNKAVFSLVVPVYNEEEVLELFYKEAKAVFEGLGEEYEFIFVDDGSADKSAEILAEFCERDARVKCVKFSRNFGHQAAVTTGMKYASGGAVIVIDCDLQDPPDVIPKMVEKWREGYAVVYGKRVKREGESVFKKLSAFIYYRALKRYFYKDLNVDAGDFRLLDRRAVDVLNAMPEKNRFLRGMNTYAGFSQTSVEYVRRVRAAGKTKYTLQKMSALALNGIYSNSRKPLFFGLRMAFTFLILGGLGLAALGVIALLNLLKLADILIIPALLPAALVLFCSGCILVNNCIQGAYLARIYDEVQDRPSYIVDKIVNFNKKEL